MCRRRQLLQVDNMFKPFCTEGASQPFVVLSFYLLSKCSEDQPSGPRINHHICHMPLRSPKFKKNSSSLDFEQLPIGSAMLRLSTVLRHSLALRQLGAPVSSQLSTSVVTETQESGRLPGRVGLEFDPQWRTVCDEQDQA